MIEVGQHNRAWRDWHMGQEQAIRALQMVRGKLLLPVHWGALTLAAHGWTSQSSGRSWRLRRPG